MATVSKHSCAAPNAKCVTTSDGNGFIRFGRSIVIFLRQVGRLSTADTYTTVLNSFSRFCNAADVPLPEVCADLMTAYETYLAARGICPNSRSFYMRNLRAIYNRADDKELVGQSYPYRRVYTGIDKTVKRAVPLTVIRSMRDMELSPEPELDFARDMFLFSFYTRGMSFVDMAYLRKSDLKNGVLTYRRRKTGQLLFVKWEKPMQDLTDKYDTAGSPYLLPIIREPEIDERAQYKRTAHFVNRHLKIIGQRLGLSIPLTSYVARHGWASIARSKNIPIATISEAMGHDSETTTRIYLASLDTAVVDRANSLILRSL